MSFEANQPPAWPKERWDTNEEYLLYLRHLAAYVSAEKVVSNRSVLEIGCGTGYGADHLSQFASSIIAIDFWKEGVQYCHAKYKNEKLIFLQANGLKLPFKDSSFDAAISFQVIEHIAPNNVLNYLLEAKRVLKRGGIFIVSTPNSKLRLLPFQKPWNPEHKKEYDFKGFKNLLSQVFEDVKVYCLRGSEEIQYIERNRVKQNPLRVYIISPLTPLLKKILPSSFWLSKVKNPPEFKKTYSQLSDKGFVNEFSVNDFRVDQNCAKDCLDLYGICAKV